MGVMVVWQTAWFVCRVLGREVWFKGFTAPDDF